MKTTAEPRLKKAVQVNLSVYAQFDVEADPIFEYELVRQLAEFNKRGDNWRFVMAYKELEPRYSLDAFIRGETQYDRQFLLIPTSFALALTKVIPSESIYIAESWVQILRKLRYDHQQLYYGQEGFSDTTIHGFRRRVEGATR